MNNNTSQTSIETYLTYEVVARNGSHGNLLMTINKQILNQKVEVAMFNTVADLRTSKEGHISTFDK